MIPILIPAYQPSGSLVELVKQLHSESLGPILVINDGSASHANSIFDQVSQFGSVTVLHHVVNLGKGAALKTGFHHALLTYPDLLGVLTVDADGQHMPKDTAALRAKFRASPRAMVLGVREFKDPSVVPWRSRFGNTLTRKIFQLITGSALTDTQTGLRAIPKSLLVPLLQISASGYEFETDMLLLAIREKVPFVQHGIETVYIDGNASSHFNPLIDSLKIYFVLFRFTLNAVFTGILDFIAFAGTQALGQSILTSSVTGRIIAGTFNFITSKRFVFQSRSSYAKELTKYITLVAFLLFVSNSAISAMVRRLDMNVFLAKVLVEASLFLLSFSIQRTFIFSRDSTPQTQTDWDAYYAKPFRATSVTRKITIGRILDFISPFALKLRGGKCVEFGGGNSCIYESLREAHPFGSYRVVDNNESGVRLFRERAKPHPIDQGIVGDVLKVCDVKGRVPPADLCFSIGLIEHFDPSGTRAAIRSHFDCTEKGGLVLITYPTPTWLYCITRGAAEFLGVWKFHDERPLKADEVTAEVSKYGKILRHEIIWPIFLTQGVILCEKS